MPADLIVAHRLYEDDGPFRWEIEARILASQTDAEIAASTGFPSAVVAAFEQQFFAVRDRLPAGDYILFGVIGYNPCRGFKESDLRSLWQYFGYAAGPKFLELVIAVSQDRPLPEWAVKEASSPVELEVLRASTKLSILAERWSFDPGKLRQLLVLHLQLLELQWNTSVREPLVQFRVVGAEGDRRIERRISS